MNIVWSMIRQLATSKKVMIFLAGLIVSFAAKKGWHVTDEMALGILGFFASLIVGQGVADIGKPAAQVQAVAMAQSEKGTPAANKMLEEVTKV